MLKRRFQIFATPLEYPVIQTQAKIILALTALHNFIQLSERDEYKIWETDKSLQELRINRRQQRGNSDNIDGADELEDDGTEEEMAALRERIATSMWEDYTARGTRWNVD